MKPNADKLAVLGDEERNLRLLVGRDGSHEVMVLSQPDARYLQRELGRKLAAIDAEEAAAATAAGAGFPVSLVRLNDGNVVVGHALPRGGAKHYMGRGQAERALAKLDESYEVWRPAAGRSYYLRLKPQPTDR